MSVFARLRNVPRILAARNLKAVTPIRRSSDDVVRNPDNGDIIPIEIYKEGRKMPLHERGKVVLCKRWYYRDTISKNSKGVHIMAEVLMTGMWYWMFYHLWYDFGHVVGHFDIPDPSKWTDAELGIPPDSEE